MTSSFRQMAEEALHRTILHNNETEIQYLTKQMELLDQHGMSNLNQTLLQNARGSARNIPDFIAEHNFGADLIRHDPQGVHLYEPPGYDRPPDFVLPRNNTTFYLQMKRLNHGEFENRRDHMLRRIQDQLRTITFGKFVSLQLAEDFTEQDVNPLVRLIETAAQADDASEHSYPTEIDPKATFFLFEPRNTTLDHLTLGSSTDMDWRDLTGEAETQIRSSLDKAIGAFTWNTDAQHVNLIVMEADQYDDMDISQAVFGEEIYSMDSDVATLRTARDTDGYFYQIQNADKLCGVVALRRTQRGTFISGYRKTLFINERFEGYIDQIRQEIGIDEVVRVNDRP
ncbi:hypothetical protein E0485_22625 [Paenibacillus albiflavus]|uniref:Uncharacterized protein n=1 Tax=Paenibacillus albiflavus TaxID=2545760 RepID=A0A4R4E1G8_9BACL|nr:hypothetical protein [Paenibacillus albiflavus]TCZ71450.1 hypothetical protein E0485_22625 [Paenibacillus albiflavus]